jgi:hypothetical protein
MRSAPLFALDRGRKAGMGLAASVQPQRGAECMGFIPSADPPLILFSTHGRNRNLKPVSRLPGVTPRPIWHCFAPTHGCMFPKRPWKYLRAKEGAWATFVPTTSSIGAVS